MSMSTSAPLRILGLLLVILSVAVGERALKPGDVFLQGHMFLQEARRMADRQDYEGAAARTRAASEMYDSIAKQWPTWSTDMLDGRRKQVRKDYARYQQLALEQGQNNLDLPQRGPSGPGIDVTSRRRPGAIAPLPRAATPRQKYQALEREVKNLRASREKLLNQSREQEDHTIASNRALGKERQRVKELESKLAVAEAELKRMDGVGVVALKNQVEDLTKQLETATSGLTDANTQNKELLAEFENNQDSLESMGLQVEELTRQRDDMNAIINGLDTGDSRLALATENSRLRELLNAAQARVDELEMDKIENEAEIASLKDEVSRLKVELTVLKKENADAEERLLAMQTLLDGTEQQSAFNPPAVGDGLARQENEMLREVINRQLKQQKFRQQKREIVIAELQTLEAGSDKLLAEIDAMASGAELSPEEQAAVQGGGLSTLTMAPLASGGSSGGDESILRKISRYSEAAAFNFEKERFEEAEFHYEEILSFAPKHIETIYNLGVTKLRLNQVKEARRLFDRACLIEPSNDRSQLMLGVCCYYLEAVDDAIIAIRKALELNPSADAAGLLGLIYLAREDLEKSIASLQSAVELAPREPIWHYNLCIALANQKAPDLDRSQKHYEEAKKFGLQPDARMEETFRNRLAPTS